jgi:NAD+ kinase
VTREILVVTHPRRSIVRESAQRVIEGLAAAGVSPRVLRDEAEQLDLTGANVVPHDADAAVGVEMVLVLGGDGSLLRGAEFARGADVPLLGVNLGHVGFLAEAEPDALESTIDHVVRKDYTVEDRMTVDVTVRRRGEVTYSGWALNEMSLEKAERARMLECVLEIDGRPLSRWGCDGVICSTPTGSTAYAFSVGGPVMWPGVQALLVAGARAERDRRRGDPGAGARRPLLRRAAPRRGAAGVAGRGCARPAAGAPGRGAPAAVHRPARRQVRPARGGLAGSQRALSSQLSSQRTRWAGVGSVR